MAADTIQMAHGSGGRAMLELIADVFAPSFANEFLRRGDDGAVIALEGGRLAMSTDSHVVDPIFFPGGNIGSLAVNGTVNDLAMMGAVPRYLTAGFILEEGLPMDDLRRVVEAMAAAAHEAGATIVTGDTKVVPRGKADRIFINTAGIGSIAPGIDLSGANARAGDRVILNGPIGDHGIAVLTSREGLTLESPIASDCAALNGLVAHLLERNPNVHVLRDPTRGGVATSLNEIAVQSGIGIRLDEDAIPVRDSVRGACELLGLDPLYVANEGKLLAVVPGDAAADLLAAMRNHPLGADAAIIGEVTAEDPGRVFLRTPIGGHRIIDVLHGDPLPRIC